MYEQVILIDFDGTVVDHEFPRIGKPKPGAFEVMKELTEAGYKLILWTCREDDRKGKYLSEAVEFCRANGIEFDAVNEALVSCDFRPDGCPKRKPHAHYVIDDRNLGGFPGWDMVRAIILGDRKNAWNA